MPKKRKKRGGKPDKEPSVEMSVTMPVVLTFTGPDRQRRTLIEALADLEQTPISLRWKDFVLEIASPVQKS